MALGGGMFSRLADPVVRMIPVAGLFFIRCSARHPFPAAFSHRFFPLRFLFHDGYG